jgi:hypothetical protein
MSPHKREICDGEMVKRFDILERPRPCSFLTLAEHAQLNIARANNVFSSCPDLAKTTVGEHHEKIFRLWCETPVRSDTDGSRSRCDRGRHRNLSSASVIEIR